ncbi:MAG: hypothetical protein ACI89U_001701 [Gammaproteobacteria bacterium]|jgi:hypothetical protein
MISITDFCLTLFLVLLSLHLGLSMDFVLISVIGAGASLAAGLLTTGIKRPTWDILILLLVAGAVVGNTLLEDVASNRSWVRYMGAPAGIYLSLLTFMIWLLAERKKNGGKGPLDRNAQSITSLGLIILFMVPPHDIGILSVADIKIPLLQAAGLLVAIIAYSANRPSPSPNLLTRILLLSPLIVIVLVLFPLLQRIQTPFFSLLDPLTPSFRDYAQTGFSPLQKLNARTFVQPSARPALRIESDGLSSRYLVGNRLSVLDDNLVWQPTNRSALKLSADGQSPSEIDYNVFTLDNHHFNTAANVNSLTIYSLKRQEYLFLPPNSSLVSGNFNELSRDVNQVWSASFDSNASRNWDVTTAITSTPEPIDPATLLLPGFWDKKLNDKSVSFREADRLATVENIAHYFSSREYSLSVDFNADKPLHDFFLSDKPAYCFWFATGTTLALRANGIPSRMVSGYLIHEKIAPKLWLVRERDAHSWVEWQDQAGFWHTLDPTPAAMINYFDGYQSSVFSHWYHIIANRAQILIDLILADEMMTNIIRTVSIIILLILFRREYRRIQHSADSVVSKQWSRIWTQFLGICKLPDNSTWTASHYIDNLPDTWTEKRRDTARLFLRRYTDQRFSQHPQNVAEEMEKLLVELKKNH